MKYTTVVDAKSGIIQVTAELVIKNFVDVMAGFKPQGDSLSQTLSMWETLQ